MDPSALIREVSIRPQLWDHKHINYHNRHLSDMEWVRVAEILGIKKDAAKHKWKSLRDNYRKELKKYRKMEGICSDEPPLPKWSHFQEMSFLTGIISATPSTNEPINASDLVSVSLKEGEESSVEMTEIAGEDSYDGEQLTTVNEFNGGTTIVKPDRSFYTRREPYVIPNPRWLPTGQYDENGDLHFLKSLLPFMKMLPPLKKLEVRSEFHNLLIKEISQLENGEMHSPDIIEQHQLPDVKKIDPLEPDEPEEILS